MWGGGGAKRESCFFENITPHCAQRCTASTKSPPYTYVYTSHFKYIVFHRSPTGRRENALCHWACRFRVCTSLLRFTRTVQVLCWGEVCVKVRVKVKVPSATIIIYYLDLGAATF